MTTASEWTFHIWRRSGDLNTAARAILASVEQGGFVQPTAREMIADAWRMLREAEAIQNLRDQAEHRSAA